jgi:hypothetical protein
MCEMARQNFLGLSIKMKDKKINFQNNETDLFCGVGASGIRERTRNG